MVKNEEKNLPRLFASVKGFADKIIVLDTGSTDGTVPLLKEMWLDDELEYTQEDFVDFGTSRTRLMQFAKGKADWLLLMDADQTLQITAVDADAARDAVEKFREQLPFTSPDITAFSLKHAGTWPYWVPRLIRGDRDWKFVGVTHEYLDGGHISTKLPDIEIVHHADGGSRADKFERDLRLLSKEVGGNPTNDRAWFYLANTYRDLGRLEEARACYEKRVTLGGWDEEVFMARLEAAKISKDPLEFWETWACRPTRAEPLYYLERRYRELGEDVYALAVESLRNKITVPEKDVLWVELAAYSAAAPTPCWKTIPGWWEDSEEEFYKRLVALLPDYGRFTEVGTFLGRSFACFDHHAKLQKKRIFKTAVDTFEGTQTEPMEAAAVKDYPRGFHAAFLANMGRCEVSDYQVFPATSAIGAARKNNASQDAVFLDGDHSTEAVDADLQAWLPKVKPGGYICGHDFDRKSVQDAVWQYFGPGQVKVHGRCWIAQVR